MHPMSIHLLFVVILTKNFKIFATLWCCHPFSMDINIYKINKIKNQLLKKISLINKYFYCIKKCIAWYCSAPYEHNFSNILPCPCLRLDYCFAHCNQGFAIKGLKIKNQPIKTGLKNLSKRIEGHALSVTLLTGWRYYPFCIGSYKSAKTVGNINTAESLKETKNRKQFASRPKGSPPLGEDSCLGFTSILIHLFSETRMSNWGFIPPKKIGIAVGIKYAFAQC